MGQITPDVKIMDISSEFLFHDQGIRFDIPFAL